MLLEDLALSCRTIAVVGMAKNVGKTVTFNYLVRKLSSRGLTIGLTSIGYDGEERDALTNLPKPKVFIPIGSLVATAESVVKLGTAKLEIIERSGEYTLLGEVLIARAETSGTVHLAGPARIRQMKRVQQRLLSLGAQVCLVDGALDRLATAAPKVTEGTVLATGAAFNTEPRVVLKRTAERIAQMQIESVDPSQADIYREVLKEAAVAVHFADGRIERLPVASALGSADKIAGFISDQTKALLISGAVADSIFFGLSAVLHKAPSLTIVVRDGTCIFSDGPGWRKFLSNGGVVKVLDPIRLLAVTVNPTSPNGPSFEAKKFLQDMTTLLTPFPVFDLMLNVKSENGGPGKCQH